MSAVKEGWTYKKLGEVGTLLRGKGIQKTDFVENGRPCIHYGQIHTIFGVSTERHITSIPDELFEQSVIASKGDVLLTLTSEDVEGSCKSTAWLGDYDIAVSSDAAIYKHSLNPKFVVYYLQSNSFYSEKAKYARGFKVTHIKTADIAEISIPVPPLPTQQSIVSELDKINELIALKKSQLKDLDSLAQSIFYEMFGDPITNEKGWEVKKVIDVVKLQRGFDLPVQNRLSTGNIPIYGSNGIVGYHTISKASYGIITGRSGSIGEVFMCDKPFWPLNTSLFSVDCHGNNILYLKFLMQSYHLERFKQGAGVPTLNRNSFHSNDIIDVPLSLQHQFAERVEAIERLKQQVQTAIKDLETLLASRMQYWFE